MNFWCFKTFFFFSFPYTIKKPHQTTINNTVSNTDTGFWKKETSLLSTLVLSVSEAPFQIAFWCLLCCRVLCFSSPWVRSTSSECSTVRCPLHENKFGVKWERWKEHLPLLRNWELIWMHVWDCQSPQAGFTGCENRQERM